MRPESLYPLFAPVESLKGVGPKLKPALTRLVGETVWDVLCHIPKAVIQRHQLDSFSALSRYDGEEILLRAAVIQHLAPSGRRQYRGVPYRVQVGDVNETGRFLELVFFHTHSDYLQKTLPVGGQAVLAGRIDFYHGKPQMVHPIILNPQDSRGIQAAKIQAVYPLTHGVSTPVLGRVLSTAVAKIPNLGEWLDASAVRDEGLATFHQALKAVHQPQSVQDAVVDGPARRRLALDELFANQLMLGLVKIFFTDAETRPPLPQESIGRRETLCQKLIAALPYELTTSQREAYAEIIESLRMSGKMLRLLQGDVGSGKTIVALLAMLWAAGDDGQAALMAPTDILARQHYQNFTDLLTPLRISVVLLTGKMRAAEKRQALQNIEQGNVRIIVGTHALFQEQVRYHNLSLAVIDEQHRFGVHQRLIFSEKARQLDMLVMSATPIPRTLMLSYWNNLQVSRLTERPAGRKEIVTKLFSQKRLEEIIKAVMRALDKEQKIYWVCPLIEESDTVTLTDVTARAEMLSARLGPDVVRVLHGKMPVSQKNAAMDDFAAGQARILVATSVIEVGVDVPDAGIIIIEHAEHFGLAALHQLRGRVGRGGQESFCLLIHADHLSPEAQQRLKIIRDNHDGFEIAEQDLRLRGGGDALGIRQSGLPAFRFVDWHTHQPLIALAHQMAKRVIDNQHYRQEADKENIKTLLYLFGHDNAARLLMSG